MAARRKYLITMICLWAALSSSSYAADFVWTGIGDAITWNSSLNWYRLSPGNPLTFPKAGDRAIFTTDALVSGGITSLLEVEDGITLRVAANTETGLAGTITNQGIMTFVADNDNNVGQWHPDTRYRIDGPVTLTGGGEIVFNGSETGLGGSGTLTNVNNTLRGPGSINVNLVNQHIVRAEGGTLHLGNILLDNNDGIVEITANGTLDLNSGVIQDGTINGLTGGLHRNGILKDVTINGVVTQAANTETGLVGTITNQGIMTFVADNDNNVGQWHPDTRYRIDGPVTLTGGGEIVFNGSETGLGGTGTLTNVNNTLRGTGSINVSLINLGILSPDGQMNIGADHTQGTGSLLNIDVAGSSTSIQSDTLNVAGDATLGGTLAFDASNYSSTGTQTREFVLLTSENLNGQFDTIEWSGNNDIYFHPQYDYANGTVHIVQGTRGDMNGDGAIDNLDVDLFVFMLMSGSEFRFQLKSIELCEANERSCELPSSQAGGDWSGNGLLDFADIPYFQQVVVGNGLGAAALAESVERYLTSPNVPEPASALLACWLAVPLALARRHRGRMDERSIPVRRDA